MSQRASPPHTSVRLLRQLIEAELHSAWLHTEAEAWGDAAAHGGRAAVLRGWRDACGRRRRSTSATPTRRTRRRGGEEADGGHARPYWRRAEEAHARLLLLQPRRGHAGYATAEPATAAADPADAADAADAAADKARALAALLASVLHRLRRVTPCLAASAAPAAAAPAAAAASPLLIASPPTASAIDAARSLPPLRGLLACRLAAALQALSTPAGRRWHERSVALVRCGGGVLERAHARLGLGCAYSAAEAVVGGDASGGGGSSDGRGLAALWRRRGQAHQRAARLHRARRGAAAPACRRAPVRTPAPPTLLREGCVALAACCGPQQRRRQRGCWAAASA